MTKKDPQRSKQVLQKKFLMCVYVILSAIAVVAHCIDVVYKHMYIFDLERKPRIAPFSLTIYRQTLCRRCNTFCFLSM